MGLTRTALSRFFQEADCAAESRATGHNITLLGVREAQHSRAMWGHAALLHRVLVFVVTAFKSFINLRIILFGYG